MSNFKLNNKDLTYEEDDDFKEFDEEDEKDNDKKENLIDLYSNNEKIADDFVNISKTIKDINFISFIIIIFSKK